MPKLDGLGFLDQLHLENVHPPKVIMMSSFDHPSLVKDAVKRGANGYLLKDTEVKELIKAINIVLKGDQYFDKRILKYVDFKAADIGLNLAAILSDKEREVLILTCLQYPNNEIADKLFVTIETVKTHKQNIKSKIKAKNTIGFMAYALINDIISLEDFRPNSE